MFLSPLLLTACGSESGNIAQDSGTVLGFAAGYVPPNPTPSEKIILDQYYNIYTVAYQSPYWVESLEMFDGKKLISTILQENNNVYLYSFPDTQPAYDMDGVSGWVSATELMKDATREIFEKISTTLDVSFIEATDTEKYNVVMISLSDQSDTAGFAYFPNPDFFVGSDVFVAKKYDAPTWKNSSLTNMDYEVLLHEIGHALGLKHPFEADQENLATLNAYEDQTKFTAMSYDDASYTFDGTFRPFDWMALTKLYGVNPNYREGDDSYSFSNAAGVFIVDGAGADTIDLSQSALGSYVDLRPGMQSWLGQKAAYVSSANQLTISHGTVVENVIGGPGADRIVGNEADNVISTGGGNDTIFAGDGADRVTTGSGADQVDFSEDVQAQDMIALEHPGSDGLGDIIYGFAQGFAGDVIDLTMLLAAFEKLLPLVATTRVPEGFVDGCVVPLFGEEIRSAADLVAALSDGGVLETIDLAEGASAVFLVAANQDSGTEQDFYFGSRSGGSYSAVHLAEFRGDYMDIDNWTADNFIFAPPEVIA